jgi:hypothetical protein
VLPPPKAGPAKKVGILNISRLKARPGPPGMSVMELALAKPIGLSKKFLLLDIAASSHAHTAVAAMTHIARSPAFDNLGDDSSSDVREAPSLERAMEKPISPPPSMSGELLCFGFAIFTMGPDNFFCRSYPSCTHARFAAGEPRLRPGVLPSCHTLKFWNVTII